MAATKNFFRNEKILFLAKVIEFSNRENTYNYKNNYIARANFNHDSPKMNFRIYLLLQCLKLGSYVLGNKTKFLIEPIFD